MAFNIMLPTGRGQAIDLGFGPSANGQPNFSFGLSNFGSYGNGLYGGAGSNTLGFSTQGGLFAQGNNTQWSPTGVSSNQWGANSFGSYNNNQSQNIFGQYQNNSYAQNVFGQYQANQTSGNGFGYTTNNQAGNVFGGPQARWGASQNIFGGGGSYAGIVPQYGAGYYGCGGAQASAFFGI